MKDEEIIGPISSWLDTVILLKPWDNYWSHKEDKTLTGNLALFTIDISTIWTEVKTDISLIHFIWEPSGILCSEVYIIE